MVNTSSADVNRRGQGCNLFAATPTTFPRKEPMQPTRKAPQRPGPLHPIGQSEGLPRPMFSPKGAHLRLPPPFCFFAPETSKPTPDHIATSVVTQFAIHLTTALLHYQLLHRVPQAVRLQQHPPFKPAKPVTVPHSRGPRATESTVPDKNNSLRQLLTSYPPRHQAPCLRCPGHAARRCSGAASHQGRWWCRQHRQL